MKKLLATLFILAGAAFVTACGQKGPLFLPGTPSTITGPAQAPASPPAEETEEEREKENDDPA